MSAMSKPGGKSDSFAGLRTMFKKYKGLEWIILLVLLCAAGSIALSGMDLFGGGSGGSSGNALEQRLSAILSSIDGAGLVDVMVYEAASPASTTVDWLGSASSAGSKVSGVVVVADGANDIRVRLELIQAVRTLLDLPTSAVEVYQRKASP